MVTASRQVTEMLGMTTSNRIRLRLIKMLTVFFSTAMRSMPSLLAILSDELLPNRNFADAVRSMLRVRSRCLYHSAYMLKKYVKTYPFIR